MSTLPALLNGHRTRGWALWLVPAAVLAMLVGWEIDWGRQVVRMPAAASPVEPKPLTAAVLPEYRIEGGLPAHAETVERTLFNATRRPAPLLAADGGPQRLKRGQFQLMGTAVTGDRNIAFLKEVAGGKSRSVRQGEEINGMLVASVMPDRVKFTLGDETEQLVLKVAPGPKTTVAAAPAVAAPAVAAVAGAGAPARAAQARAQAAANAGQAQAQAQPQPQPQPQPQDSRQARRAARAAAAGHGDAGATSGQDTGTAGQGGRQRNK